VLVALAIVAISLGAGLKAAGALTDNAQRLADVTAAQWCADNMLINIRLARQFPASDSEFECQQLGRTFKGELRSERSANANFRVVHAVVLNDAGHQLIKLSTVVGRY